MRVALPMPVLFAFLAACSRGEPEAEPEDPCTELFEEYERARTAAHCSTDADCVFAEGIAAPAAQEGRLVRAPLPCGSAATEAALPQVEAVVVRWRAHACGPVGAPGSSACASFSHGARVACRDAICTAVY